jgi:hypothetical protein
VSLLSIKIYYTLCPTQIKDLVLYPKTSTGANSTDLVPRKGYCVENAQSRQVPFAWCQANGNWFIASGSDNICKCKQGYYYLPNSSKCLGKF